MQKPCGGGCAFGREVDRDLWVTRAAFSVGQMQTAWEGCGQAQRLCLAERSGGSAGCALLTQGHGGATAITSTFTCSPSAPGEPLHQRVCWGTTVRNVPASCPPWPRLLQPGTWEAVAPQRTESPGVHRTHPRCQQKGCWVWSNGSLVTPTQTPGLTTCRKT